MKTQLEELIEELIERQAFLENTDCISESLEVKYIIELCKKKLEVKRIILLIEMYEKEKQRLMVVLKPYYEKQQYAKAKEYQDRLNHINEFIYQLKTIEQ